MDWSRLLELDDEAFIKTFGIDRILETYIRQRYEADNEQRPILEGTAQELRLEKDLEAELAGMRSALRAVLQKWRDALKAIIAFAKALAQGDSKAAEQAVARIRLSQREIMMLTRAQSGTNTRELKSTHTYGPTQTKNCPAEVRSKPGKPENGKTPGCPDAAAGKKDKIVVVLNPTSTVSTRAC